MTKTIQHRVGVVVVAKATQLKGVYNLNPTRMIFKQGSLGQRIATSSDIKGFKKVQPPKATTRKRK